MQIKRYLIFLLMAYPLFLFGKDLPNILWIYAEDTSPWMGCYGDAVNADATPQIDSIAEAGVQFTRAFVPAPVCSATRSAMMLGQNAIRFGGHEHRSSRAGPKIHLPEGYELLPQLLQRHGYTTFNHGKTDYNFVWDAGVYNYTAKSKTDFTELVGRQPFFGQIQTKGGKNNTSKFPEGRKVDPNSVSVPLDYPDNAVYRQVVAQHYDAIRMDDDLIGEILSGLREAGLAENTIVVYFSDHGANNLLRHKQMTTEGGLHVPFVVMGPKAHLPERQVRDDLVDMLDLSATTLAWAGIEAPEWYEGRDLFAADFEARGFVGGQKDRLDHTVDRVRTIRTERFRYVRNYKLDRIFLQPQYRDKREYTQNLHQLFREGKLSNRHREIYFGERPAEEFYDVSVDPEMMVNLVGNTEFANELARHRSILAGWLAEGDLGVGEEPIGALQANGEGTNWGEGVNVEYEVYREDSDGDGLSDKWESLNGRDPNDGRLYFGFDCGGWQTEGWFSEDISSNLAGYLGTLEFFLDSRSGSIRREGLKIQANEQDTALAMRIHTSKRLELSLYVNDRMLGSQRVGGSDDFGLVRFPLNAAKWNGLIRNLEVRFEGAPNTDITIDLLKVERGQSPSK
jgi:arylsulfatase A-like enzyme